MKVDLPSANERVVEGACGIWAGAYVRVRKNVCKSII